VVVRLIRTGFFLASLAFSASFLVTPCFAHHVAVVVDKENKTQNIPSAQLVKIIKGEFKKWPDGKTVVLVLETTPDILSTLAHLTKMSAAGVKAMIDARKESILRLPSDAEVIETVASTPGAIGMVEEHSISGRVSVVKVDGKLPLEAGYLPH